jgi:hypothetical protein
MDFSLEKSTVAIFQSLVQDVTKAKTEKQHVRSSRPTSDVMNKSSLLNVHPEHCNGTFVFIQLK